MFLALLQQAQPLVQPLTQIPQQLVVPIDIKWLVGIIGTIMGAFGSILLIMVGMLVYWVKKLNTTADKVADGLTAFQQHVSITYKQKSECKPHEVVDKHPDKITVGLNKIVTEFGKMITEATAHSKRMEKIVSHMERKKDDTISNPFDDEPVAVTGGRRTRATR